MGKLPLRRPFSVATSQIIRPNGLKCTRPPELVRQFIDDCLYNKTHGYFNRLVNIFDGGSEPINFRSLKDQEAYTKRLHDMYRQQSREDEEYYQLWHTPSELFKPWYGQGIAKYMIEKNLKCDGLVIYEIGPGNGTLAKNILDHLRASDPKLYERTVYNLVEISSTLSKLQRLKLADHQDRVKHHQCSVTDLPVKDERPAFVLAMEVLDNMPHDRITYDEDGSLLQAMVYTNDDACSLTASPGRYTEIYEPVEDQLIIDYMNMMDGIGRRSPSLRWHPLSLLDPIMSSRNSWRSEFIPTTAFQALRHLKKAIPNHRLIISDFSSLPDAVRGHCGPVVQTRYKGDTVSCSTYLLQRGLFDVFFPTDFNLLRKVHESLLGRQKGSGLVLSHAEFCRRYADVGQTETSSGYNPMLEEFQNVHFYLSA